MPIKNTAVRYGLIAKTFHWLLFLMILGALVGGYLQTTMEDGPDKNQAGFLHMSFGFTILVLAMLRLTWRLYNTQPAASSALSAKEQSVSRLMHYCLYVLMLAQPLSGMLMLNSAGYGLNWFGVFTVPPLVAESESLNGFMHECHEIIWILLAVFIIGHAGAAIKHHFIDKNDVLKRMLKG